MTQPGRRLRALAARFCSARTMQRLIDPVIADLQAEYAAARSQQSVWRARRVLLTGYIAYWKVLVAAGALGFGDIVRHEAPVLWTVALIFTIVTGLITLLLAGPGNNVAVYPDTTHPSRVALLLYLIPSQLPLSVPLGLGVALIGGLTAARLRTRTLVVIAALSVAQGITMFANMEWLVPDSNQAFREEVMGRPLPRASNELSLSGLRQRLESAKYNGLSTATVRHLELAFHARWAYSAAPAFVTALALSLILAIRPRPLARVLTAAGFSIVYFVLVLCSNHAGQVGALPPLAAAWTPNLACMILTLMLSHRLGATASFSANP